MKTFCNIILKILIVFVILIVGLQIFYIKVLPYLVSNDKVINYVQKKAKESLNVDLQIKNPNLKTSIYSDVKFYVDEFSLKKNDEKILMLKKFDTDFSLKVFAHKLIIRKITADELFINVNETESVIPKSDKAAKCTDWIIDVFDALLGVKKCEILYVFPTGAKIHLKGEHIGVNNAEKIKKNVYFQIFANISSSGKQVTLDIKDDGRVYFQNKQFYINDCLLKLNQSSILVNLIADKKQNFDINLVSKHFDIKDILDFLDTQIVENNIKESLVYFDNIKGNIDFDLNLKKEDIYGNLVINNIAFNVKDIDNVPVKLINGKINISPNQIKILNIEGFYDYNSKNKLSFQGVVNDYLKSIDTNIEGKAIVSNEFFKKHLSKLTGVPMEIKGEAPLRINLKSVNNIIDLKWLFMLKPGQNIKVGGNYLPFEDCLRFMNSNIHFENMILDIKSLDYHMVQKDKILSREEYTKRREQGEKFEPIFRIKSSIDIAKNNYIKFVEFEIPKPLPSELLNAVFHQDIFKRGFISGNMTYNNSGIYPVLNGSMSLEKVIIPIQKMFVKSALLEAKDNFIHIDLKGGYRRSKIKFDGKIVNVVKFPIIIKDINLSIENLDLYKILEGVNSQNNLANEIITDDGVVDVEHSGEEFDIRNIIIEKCRFHLDKGKYKDIELSNLDADLTLNKDGVINISSNRFDFAEGKSSLKARFDLINKTYNTKLGILNVNSEKVAKALLNLENEIVGKASGFLDLTTDNSMMLSGSIKFLVKDGTIKKIGLVEYVLKCASLFRNTVTMINPAVIADIIKVPDGDFNKITGELKLHKNVVTHINIKTYSPEISAYIAGRYNINNGDTSLRVYTKFSNVKKGFIGGLRKISIDSLALRISPNSKNDANYYAVELAELPAIDIDEKDCQIYLTKIEGNVFDNNYISSLKRIK